MSWTFFSNFIWKMLANHNIMQFTHLKDTDAKSFDFKQLNSDGLGERVENGHEKTNGP